MRLASRDDAADEAHFIAQPKVQENAARQGSPDRETSSACGKNYRSASSLDFEKHFRINDIELGTQSAYDHLCDGDPGGKLD